MTQHTPRPLVDAGRPIGGEPDRGLMAQTHQLKPSIVFERFVQVQDEVAGNSEDVADAVVPELIEEKVQFHYVASYLVPTRVGAQADNTQ